MLDTLCTRHDLDAVQAEATSLVEGGDGWSRFIMRGTQKPLRADKLARIMRGTHKGVGMVRLPALITEFARLDGRPRSTIAWYARLAREAGKMPTTKRGQGAAHMGVREAVNLILACNGAEDPKQGANAIERFRSYTPYLYEVGGKEKEGLDEIENCDIRDIGLEPNLGKALEKLIHRTPSLFKTLNKNSKYRHTKISTKNLFFEIKTSLFISLSLKEGQTIIRLSEASFYSYDIPHFEKNNTTIYYCDDVEKRLNQMLFGPVTNFRSVEVNLEFGVFLGLAKLFFEDSMEFPDELIPQSKGGGGDG